ncbi:FHA domain-containing protein [Deinococcus malanensis]|uniref:FHA domain-containing protein n=1 Tax=Deinococcus malanensis TaxID=1706855 RepID=UPI00166B0E3F|nr:FHA domain-containing protein [Deinococcus malanensis]
MVLGRFHAATGPVDIDVTDLPGAQHVSRRHAQFVFHNGTWNVQDLDSANGVFLKRTGDSAYSAAISQPAELQDGDEVAFGNLMLIFRQNLPT